MQPPLEHRPRSSLRNALTCPIWSMAHKEFWGIKRCVENSTRRVSERLKAHPLKWSAMEDGAGPQVSLSWMGGRENRSSILENFELLAVTRHGYVLPFRVRIQISWARSRYESHVSIIRRLITRLHWIRRTHLPSEPRPVMK